MLSSSTFEWLSIRGSGGGGDDDDGDSSFGLWKRAHQVWSGDHKRGSRFTGAPSCGGGSLSLSVPHNRASGA